MRFKFKQQRYQTDAVQAVVDCFAGQPKGHGLRYTADPGRRATASGSAEPLNLQIDLETGGFANDRIAVGCAKLLENVQAVQRRQNLPLSTQLVTTRVSGVNLDIEMETGTGKTYCYIKTMFELNQAYGWGKFIVVVPSIAIREGVLKSFEIMGEHFLEIYGKRIRYFVYNSGQLSNLEGFSADAGINVMVINVQAFNARGEDARRIHLELDEFQSRRPIDVIKKNRPILILDEPQKMEGKATTEKLAEFAPLMILRYSATHKTQHNKVYRLDAIDAYNQKLVKKISVRGITVKGLAGTNAYLYLDSIKISANEPPEARAEIEIHRKSGIQRVTRMLRRSANLYELSDHLDQYRGFVVSDVNALENTISFTNGVVLGAGEAIGDVSETALRRIQIREAIKAHFDKEQVLFGQGVKVLSLFFIDEVAKYRSYDESGEQAGEYARMFEEEYDSQLNEVLTLEDSPYNRYLKNIQTARTHGGYFSIDKKTRRLVNPGVKARGEFAGEADDVDAYDLILRDKARLLSFEEPVRFIFSHSALREGWDNPNVFVICTLKHSDNKVSRRQEVGRGMRLAVSQSGDRIDDPALVHQLNVLTVVANESYRDFVAGLQSDISASLSDRPFSAALLPEIDDDRKRKVNTLSVNFDKPEFRDLWARISRKAVYAVQFESRELIDKCIVALDEHLRVSPLRYTLISGEQKDQTTYEDVTRGDSFVMLESATERLASSAGSLVKYDLIGKLAESTGLTRRTVASILRDLDVEAFGQFKANPEDFIVKASALIQEQKATIVVEHLAYSPLDESYGVDTFTHAGKEDLANAFKASRHIYEYVVTDSATERAFVSELDASAEVVVYAKLPRSFHIPTPMGNYTPNWAIALRSDKIKHVYFVAETKGAMLSMQMREIEKAKAECARKFFAKITSDEVRYEVVDSYSGLLDFVI
ncbi:MAG: type restriction enzyme [Gammaproteobacteria bacterium]|nr:type restriction enzyme [Gammaproteobacteria bacterium]